MMRSTFAVGAAGAATVMNLANAETIEWLVLGLVALLLVVLAVFFALLRSDRPLKYYRRHRNGGFSSLTIEIPRRRRRS
jgi:hypothetical protein